MPSLSPLAAARPGALPHLSQIHWGTHVCYFYDKKEELLELLAPFFREGLERNERCVWVVSEPLSIDEARDALDRAVDGVGERILSGQLELINAADWYTQAGGLDTGRALAGWTRKEQEALRGGFDGLRLTGDTIWLERSHWHDFQDYERSVNAAIGQYRMKAICTYPLSRCSGNDVIDVVQNHQAALIKKNGAWAFMETTTQREAREALMQMNVELETRVRRRTNELQLITDALPVLISYIDEDERYRFNNKAYEAWFGAAAAALAGRSLPEVLGEEAYEAIAPHVRKALSGETVTFESELRYKSGARYVQATYVPNIDETGRPKGFYALVEDISKRKEAERERENLLEQQAALVERLAKQASDLARSNAELEQFAFISSHDLKEPLRKIAGFAHILASKYRGRIDPEADRYIGHMTRSVLRLQALIDALLLYSRATAAEETAGTADLNAVAKEAMEDLDALIAQRQAEVTVETLPTVKADPVRMRHVFQNLIGNAIKFCNRPPRIAVYAEPRGDEGLIAVRDNGIGIEPRYWEQIFKVFQRLHPRERYPGTGVGLALCKKIIEHHGGKIWVSSQPGTGSTFLFTLPRTGS